MNTVWFWSFIMIWIIPTILQFKDDKQYYLIYSLIGSFMLGLFYMIIKGV